MSHHRLDFMNLREVFLKTIRNTVITSSLPSSSTAPTLVIGTHDGNFHCDESLAISLLKLLPAYQDALVIRSRVPDLLATCQIVVDVGAIYDPNTLRFDHHQREFTDIMEGYSTKLSSAGLIYRHFGKDIIRTILNREGDHCDERLVNICFEKMYKGFIEHIDAIDNGISVSDGELKYQISTTLSSRVGMLNPSWNEPQSSEIMNSCFMRAMELTGTEFLERLLGIVNNWWPARSIVERSLANRFEVHSSGKLIIFEQGCPWKEHLFEIEKEMSCEGEVLYALYQDTNGSWRIQAVPMTPDSFDSRKKLPTPWRGVRDSALSELVGVEGAIFVHASGFIGGHKTKEGALSMAIQALTLD